MAAETGIPTAIGIVESCRRAPTKHNAFVYVHSFPLIYCLNTSHFVTRNCQRRTTLVADPPTTPQLRFLCFPSQYLHLYLHL
jgi:hypothetical protein